MFECMCMFACVCEFAKARNAATVAGQLNDPRASRLRRAGVEMQPKAVGLIHHVRSRSASPRVATQIMRSSHTPSAGFSGLPVQQMSPHYANTIQYVFL
jgi:hypothetical protein